MVITLRPVTDPTVYAIFPTCGGLGWLPVSACCYYIRCRVGYGRTFDLHMQVLLLLGCTRSYDRLMNVVPVDCYGLR